MNSRFALVATAIVVAAGLAPRLVAARAAADILPTPRRQATVDTLAKLLQRSVPPPVSAESPNPFNPPGFEQPDPAAKGSAPTPGTRPGPVSPGGPAAPTQPSGPANDREILETLAARIPSTASMNFGGKTLLVVGKNRMEAGTRFIVTYNDQDYELELVAIDRTTFTLRYRGEEYTRPIKLVK